MSQSLWKIGKPCGRPMHFLFFLFFTFLFIFKLFFYGSADVSSFSQSQLLSSVKLFHSLIVGWTQGLRASSLQFTFPLEFNVIFSDGFTLRHELTAGSKIRDPVPAKFKHVTNIVTWTLLCCDYVTYVLALKFPKSWLRTLGCRQKIHHFFFSHKWGTRFKYLSKLYPYILMYSALHIMQWFSRLLDVFTPKIKWKFFDFYILWIKTNVAYTRLEMMARLGRSIALQLQRQTHLLLCTINCFLQWDHLPNMAVSDLAFYYTLYLWLNYKQA